MIASRIWRALFSVPDSASTSKLQRVVPELAHVLRDGAGRVQPRFEAFVPDAGHHRRDEVPLRRAEIDGFAGARRLDANAGQRILARSVIGKPASARLQYGAVDLAEARPLVLHARLGSGREHERRRVGRVRHQRRRRRARAECDARRHRQRGDGYTRLNDRGAGGHCRSPRSHGPHAAPGTEPSGEIPHQQG